MIKYIEKYHSHLYYSVGFICFALFLIQRIPGCSLKIGAASPVLLLPMVMVAACFLREWAGFWVGFLSGVALDTVGNGSPIFYTITFLLFGVSFGLLFRFLLNRNIKSIVIAGMTGSFLFCLLRWFFLSVLTNDSSAGALLIRYEMPSAIYTGLLVIPLFYLMKRLCKKHLIQQ